MLDAANISSLTDFKRHSLEYIQRLKLSGSPEVLTVNGKAAVVVQDAAAYQELLRKADYAETVEAIRAGMAAHQRGEGIPMRDALEAIANKADFSLKQ
jgi:hypothetical protein